MVCHNCGREIKLVGKAMRSDECPHCKADVHCCKNCRFFDPGKSNQCAEPQADYVRDKVKANFCDYFQANNRLPLTKRASEPVQRDDARKNFDKLFSKGGAQGNKEDGARDAFDKLFKK
ncbi:MAG: hypothetical protein HY011_35900 [Acidobacteria bacterium]|nr:hypothetical protein [Acidobacteriota bacterium]